LIFFLFSLFIPIIDSIPAYAAAPPGPQAIKNGTFFWYDRYTIHAKIGEKTYYARFKADGGFNYYIKNSDCYGRIQFYRNVYGDFTPDAPAPTKAQVDMDYIDPASSSSDCRNTDEVDGFPNQFPNIDIGKPGNFNIFFRVSEDGRHLIDVSDDGNDYTQSGQYANLFVRDSENGASCQDVIQVNRSNGTYKSYEIDKNGDGSKPPASIHAANDCKITGRASDYAAMAVNQKLGDPNNLKNNPNPGGPGGGGGGEDNELTDCDLQVSNPLSWILCPVIDLGANGTDWLFQNVIEPLLSDIPLSVNPKDDFFQAWQGFRFIANVILVIGMLGIVYSMARGDR
jgi:hypothetical protein